MSCVDREARESVTDSYCDPELRPRNAQRCSNGNCEPNTVDTFVLVNYSLSFL